jgi:hypothetical protein
MAGEQRYPLHSLGEIRLPLRELPKAKMLRGTTRQLFSLSGICSTVAHMSRPLLRCFWIAVCPVFEKLNDASATQAEAVSPA